MLKIIKIIIWIGIITGGIFFWKYSSFESTIINKDERVIEVSGGGFQSVLVSVGANPLLTKIYLSQNIPDFSLQKGKYLIPENTNIQDFLDALKTPINITDQQITFLEGWNIYDIDKTLSSQGLIQAGKFVDFVTSCESFCPLKANYAFISDAETLEGFLYPDTYNINPKNFTIEGLVRKMLTNFQKKVIDTEIISDMGSIEILDVINMASIVQKEANIKDNPEEIALIAGVLKKRLAEGWQIGADATVCYAHKISTQDCDPTQVLRYLYDKNEYNTRQMVGLPRGPIANPEASVIEATVKSKASAYYYYLHDNSGQIHYGISNADHEANKNTYLR